MKDLKRYAHKYHGHVDRGYVLRKYGRALQQWLADHRRTKILNHACIVAAWICYAPKGEVAHQAAEVDGASTSPVQLLAKMLNTRCREKLPERLVCSLANVKQVMPHGLDLKCLRQADRKAWMQLRKALPRAQATKIDAEIIQPDKTSLSTQQIIVDVPVLEPHQPDDAELRQLKTSIDKWSSLESGSKTEYLQMLEARLSESKLNVGKDGHHLDAAELESILHSAIAALSPPRLRACRDTSRMEELDDMSCERLHRCAEQQRIVRRIVADVLRELPHKSGAVPIFGLLRSLIDDFEQRHGDIANAAASKQWKQLKELSHALPTVVDADRRDDAVVPAVNAFMNWQERFGASSGVFKPAISMLVELAGGSATISEMHAILDTQLELKASLEEHWPDLKGKLVASNFTKCLSRTGEHRNGENVWHIAEKAPRGVELRVDGARAFGKVQADGHVWRVYGPYRASGAQAACDRKTWDTLRAKYGQDFRGAIAEAVNVHGFDQHCKKLGEGMRA